MTRRKKVLARSAHGLVEQQRLADVLDLGDRTPQVKRFRQDDFEDLHESIAVSSCPTPQNVLLATDLLYVDTMAGTAEDQARLHRARKALCLVRDFLLLFLGEVDKVVVLCADEEGDGGLVEAAALPVPLLDAVERAFARKVKHEEDRDRVVANEREHVDELALPAEVPD